MWCKLEQGVIDLRPTLMMQWWEWNYDLKDVAAFKVYSLRLVSISVSISVELLRSHIILIVTNMDINISCLFQDSNIVFNWHDIITTLGHHESSLWHHYETWLCHSSPSWWNLQLHHQKQLHRSEKLDLLPNQREVKKQTRGKKTRKDIKYNRPHGYLHWGSGMSTIWQNPAYVDMFSYSLS